MEQQVALILSNFRLNRLLMEKLLADVPDEDLASQPAGIVNHAAWQTGHIIVTLIAGLRMLGRDESSPDGWDERFNIGSSPIGDRAHYPSKADLLAVFNRVADAYEEILPSVDQATLGRQNPLEGFRRVCPTVGDAVSMLTTSHIGYHQGQLSSWRRAQGLGPIL